MADKVKRKRKGNSGDNLREARLTNKLGKGVNKGMKKAKLNPGQMAQEVSAVFLESQGIVEYLNKCMQFNTYQSHITELHCTIG